jgi:hypothetical protein
MAALVFVLGITTSEVMAQMLQLPLRNPPRITSALPGASKFKATPSGRIVVAPKKLFGAKASIEQGTRTPDFIWSRTKATIEQGIRAPGFIWSLYLQ